MKKVRLLMSVVIVMLVVAAFAGIMPVGAVMEQASYGLASDTGVRTETPVGLRFTAKFDSVIRESELTTEYGFIMARKSALEQAGIVNTAFKLESSVNKVHGVAYGEVDGEKVDIYNSNSDYVTLVTGVLFDIPENGYEDNIVARFYVKHDGETYYTKPCVSSLYDAAVDTQYGIDYRENFTDDERRTVDDIVDTANHLRISKIASYEKDISQNYSIILDTQEPHYQGYTDSEGDLRGIFCVPTITDGRLLWACVSRYSPILELTGDNTAKVKDEYIDKLCIYSCDNDGMFAFEPVSFYAERQDAGVLDSEDKTALFYADVTEPLNAERVAGPNFDIGFDKLACVNSDTRIVVKLYYEDTGEYEFVACSTVDEFVQCIEICNAYGEIGFDKASYLLSNNTDTNTRENLVLFYAEKTLETKYQKPQPRIVSKYDVFDEGGLYRYYYEVLNPRTGEIERDVPGAVTAQKALELPDALASGTIVFVEDGCVDDAAEQYFSMSDATPVWIKGIESSGNAEYLSVVPFDDSLDCKTCVNEYVENCLAQTVTDIFGKEQSAGSLAIKDTTAFSVLTSENYTSQESLYKYGVIKATTAEALADKEKNLLGYNDSVENSDGAYETEYADYIKAYILMDDLEENLVDFVLVVVTNEDNTVVDNESHNHSSQTEPEAENAYRIVSSYEIAMDEDGLWRNYYKLYNPYTASVETTVMGTASAEKAKDLPTGLETGTLIKMENNLVLEDAEAEYKVITSSDFVWLTNLKTVSGGYAFSATSFDESVSCSDCLDGNAGTVIVSAQTPIAVLENSSQNSIFKYGIMSETDLEAVVSANENNKNKELLCYNDYAEDENGLLNIAYSSNVKAYVLQDDADNAEFVVVVVNGNEQLALDKKCKIHMDNEVVIDGSTVEEMQQEQMQQEEIEEAMMHKVTYVSDSLQQ